MASADGFSVLCMVMKRGFMREERRRRGEVLGMNNGCTLHSARSWRGERFTSGTLEGVKEIMGAGPALPEVSAQLVRASRAAASSRNVLRSMPWTFSSMGWSWPETRERYVAMVKRLFIRQSKGKEWETGTGKSLVQTKSRPVSLQRKSVKAPALCGILYPFCHIDLFKPLLRGEPCPVRWLLRPPTGREKE